MKFIDSNVFIYAADSKNHEKRTIARKLISSVVLSGGYRINVQVLNEFSSVAYRKLGLTVDEIKAYLEMFRALPVLPVSAGVTEKGLDVMNRYGLQFYDSLLLVAASENGCDEFVSEDLNDGQIYCGMKAVNPFKEIV